MNIERDYERKKRRADSTTLMTRSARARQDGSFSFDPSSDQDMLKVLIKKILSAQARGLCPAEVCQCLEVQEPTFTNKWRTSEKLHTAVHIALSEMVGVEIQRVDSVLVGHKGSHQFVELQRSNDGANGLQNLKAASPIAMTPVILAPEDEITTGSRRSNDGVPYQPWGIYQALVEDRSPKACWNDGSNVQMSPAGTMGSAEEFQGVMESINDLTTRPGLISPKENGLGESANHRPSQTQSPAVEEPYTQWPGGKGPDHCLVRTPEVQPETCPWNGPSHQERGATPDHLCPHVNALCPPAEEAAGAKTLYFTRDPASSHVSRRSSEAAQENRRHAYYSPIEFQMSESASSEEGVVSWRHALSSTRDESESQITLQEGLAPHDAEGDSRYDTGEGKAISRGMEVVPAEANGWGSGCGLPKVIQDAEKQMLIDLGRQVQQARILKAQCERYTQKAARMNAQLQAGQTELNELIGLANINTIQYNNLDSQHKNIQAQLLESQRRLLEAETLTRASRDEAKSKDIQCQVQKSLIEEHLKEWDKKDAEYNGIIRGLGLLIPGYMIQ